MPHIASLHVYPIKSTAVLNLESSRVNLTGLENDRRWLLISGDGKMMTGREYQQMLNLLATPTKAGLHLRFGKDELAVNDGLTDEETRFQLWSQQVSGFGADEATNRWVSKRLGVACRLIFQGTVHRAIPEKEGAITEGSVSFADQAPIQLVAQASVDELNTRLERPVRPLNFRPNIVVEGGTAFAEDGWKKLRIGDCEFDVLEGCKRCVFTTIDPDTHEKDPHQEPMRTLARYRKHPRGGVSFGIQLVPRTTGLVRLGDTIEILS